VYIILEFGGYLFFKSPTPITGQLLSTYQEISTATRLIIQVKVKQSLYGPAVAQRVPGS